MKVAKIYPFDWFRNEVNDRTTNGLKMFMHSMLRRFVRLPGPLAVSDGSELHYLIAAPFEVADNFKRNAALKKLTKEERNLLKVWTFFDKDPYRIATRKALCKHQRWP